MLHSVTMSVFKSASLRETLILTDIFQHKTIFGLSLYSAAYDMLSFGKCKLCIYKNARC